ncbi:acyl-CoA N-acyltransferase [Phanerochaete sordida]|uniref:Acyl-CoA N-acyltransferase n=1 Tax=Phanerochaete sordida TaxID=48140 RepID=A0A9P3GNL9_9APHY|nr:acyl-CoA N-acyltransferase [Phanerochaete sordida]
MSLQIVFDLVKASEIPDAHRIETACFPPDEAATLEKFLYRQAQAPDLFLGAYDISDNKRVMVGYICSTLSSSPTLTHESMDEHEPSGSSVCIHAVCVSPSHRHKGIALGLLREYISRLERAARDGGHYERILLIAHEDLRGLYEKAGFEWLGKSAVVHGALPWYEMRRVLPPPAASQPPQQQQQQQAVPAGLWEALQRSSTRQPPAAQLLAAYPGGIDDVVEQASSSSALANKVDLLCPRPGCGSIILKNGVATLVERESVQLEPAAAQGGLEPLPAPPATLRWWRVTPNAMAFENIGFSKTVLRETDGKRLKLLSCAECDLGPLGWCEEGGSEFWLASTRVAYRA